MSLTGDLFTYINNDATFIAECGSDKLFDLYVPEDTTYPYCTLFRESQNIEDHLDGKTSLRMSNYSLSILTETSVKAEAIEEVLIELLASVRGTIGTSDVLNIYYEGSTDSFIAPVDASEESIHVTELSLEVHWRKT